MDRSFAGRPIVVGKRPYARGLGAAADSRIEIALGPGCREFRAAVGVDSHAKQPGAVVFVVRVDGKALWRSELRRRGQEPLRVAVDLAGATKLALITDAMGAPAGDQADWADARILLANGTEVFLSEAFGAQGLPEKTPFAAMSRPRALRANVRDYGAVGDGRSDDSAAFQTALDDIAYAGKGVLVIPAGDYRIDSLVSVDVADAQIAVTGDGQGVSSLYGHNPHGVLRLRDETCRSQITVRDLSLFASLQGAGTAIEVSSPPRGARNYRTLVVRDVEIRGAGLPSRKYFNHGIKAIAQWRPLLVNVIFSGVSDPAVKRDYTDTSPLYKPACGIQADWCYAPSFQHCYVWCAHTGYRIVSEGRPEGPEDCAFYRSNAVNCRVGIDISTPIPEPQLVIDACHINCRDVGIRLHNRKFFHIVNNLMYGIDGVEAFPYTDIRVTGRSWAGIVSGNIFQSPARHNFKPTPTVERTMIHVGGTCRHLAITDNVFNAKGRALAVEKGATDITWSGNHTINRQTVPPEQEERPSD